MNMFTDTIRLRIPIASRLTIPESVKLEKLTVKCNTTKSELIRILINKFVKDQELKSEIINPKNLKS